MWASLLANGINVVWSADWLKDAWLPSLFMEGIGDVDLLLRFSSAPHTSRHRTSSGTFLAGLPALGHRCLGVLDPPLKWQRGQVSRRPADLAQSRLSWVISYTAISFLDLDRHFRPYFQLFGTMKLMFTPHSRRRVRQGRYSPMLPVTHASAIPNCTFLCLYTFILLGRQYALPYVIHMSGIHLPDGVATGAGRCALSTWAWAMWRDSRPPRSDKTFQNSPSGIWLCGDLRCTAGGFTM